MPTKTSFAPFSTRSRVSRHILVSCAALAAAALCAMFAWRRPEPGAALVPDAFQAEGSFVAGGPYPVLPVGIPERPSLRTFGSWLDQRNQSGTLKSSVFHEPPCRFALFLSGYPKQNSIAVERTDTSDRRELVIGEDPGQNWRLYLFELPKPWRGAPIRLVASVKGENSGWMALSEPFAAPGWRGGPEVVLATGKMWLLLFLQFVLLALPMAAATVWALRAGLDRAAAFAVGTCVMALAGYAALWMYLCSSAAGSVLSLLTIPAASTLLLLAGRSGVRELAAFRWPVALCLLASILYLSCGYLYGGMESPAGTAAHRYFGWAADNELPYVYAAKILHAPLAAVWQNWNVYARPPLMTGLVLLLSPFGFGPLPYHTLGTVLQVSAIAGAWTFLEAFGVRARERAGPLLMVVFSAFVLMNAFYVWPKLLTAAFLFPAAGLLFRPGFPRHRGEPYLAGALIGLSMLSHGGSAFPVIVIGLALPFWRKPAVRLWSVVPLAAAAVMLPWSVYSGLKDSSHDLINWHMGGTLPFGVPKDASPFTVIRRAYTTLPTEQIIDNKIQNLRMQFAPRLPAMATWTSSAATETAMLYIFSSTAFVVSIPLGALLLGLAGNIRSKQPAWSVENAQAVRAGILLGVFSTLIWCVMMFGPHMVVTDAVGSSATATLPTGPYWPALSLLIALALAAVRFRRLAVLALVGQIAVFVAIAAHDKYVVASPATLTERGLPDAAMAASALVCAVAVIGLSLSAARQGDPD